jgi:hypothetical protein
MRSPDLALRHLDIQSSRSKRRNKRSISSFSKACVPARRGGRLIIALLSFPLPLPGVNRERRTPHVNDSNPGHWRKQRRRLKCAQDVRSPPQRGRKLGRIQRDLIVPMHSWQEMVGAVGPFFAGSRLVRMGAGCAFTKSYRSCGWRDNIYPATAKIGQGTPAFAVALVLPETFLR